MTKLIGRIVPQTNINVKVSLVNKPYKHPDTHPASMIEEEDNRMFMTMTEKEELQGFIGEGNICAYTDRGNKGMDNISPFR